MNARILPPKEWDSAPGHTVARSLDPNDCRIVVVEEGGAVVATMAVLRVVHFESLWIDPAKRGSPTLVKRLLESAHDAAQEFSAPWIWAASAEPHTDDLLTRIGGVKMPVSSFILPVEKGDTHA